MNACTADDPIEKELLKIHTAYASIIMQKCDIGIRLKALYEKKDTDGLAGCITELQSLLATVEELHSLYAARWYKTYKPFSFDERDLRFGGIRARISRAIQRVESYLNHEIDAIEELEAERLSFENRETPFAHLYYIEKMRRP